MNMDTRRRPSREVRSGIAATEFAVALPLLMTLALAAADFGRVFHAREVVASAARAGVFQAAGRGFSDFTRATWEADVRAAVLAEMANLPGFDEADLEFELTVVDGADDRFTAELALDYEFQCAVAWPFLPQTATIHERFILPRFR
jgi:Flp pilus assembly protein TadG